MRNFKEIVSFIDPKDTSSVTKSEVKQHKKPYMIGTLVTIKNDIVEETGSNDIPYGVVIKQIDRTHSLIATNGTVFCLCKSSRYKVGDYIRVCDIYGVGSKYESRHKSFKLSNSIKQIDSFGIVEEAIDLRTVYIGLVKIKLLEK